MLNPRRALAGAALVALLSGTGGFYLGHMSTVSGSPGQWLRHLVGVPSPTPARVVPGDWRQLDAVRAHVKERYVDPIPEDELVRGAIRGLVESTGDKYSNYMTTEQYTGYLRHFQESFGGVGVQVELKDNFVTVVRPIQGTPGEKAGLRTGDRIMGVDGRDTVQLSLDEVVQLIRGPEGTQVRLTVSREPYRDRFEVSLTRSKIQTPNMSGYMLQSGIGYIRIEEFNSKIGERVRDKISELRGQGMRGLILDLRQNPGGLLSEAVDVASLFVGPGPVVHIVGRDGNRETYNSHGKGFDLPLAVLVDEGSASASEIVAGAVKDRHVGVLIGVKTFGKGSVQTFFDLEGGAGLKLTTARYLTAGGHSIHQKGIEPDVVVETPKASPADLLSHQNPQIQRAADWLKARISS